MIVSRGVLRMKGYGTHFDSQLRQRTSEEETRIFDFLIRLFRKREASERYHCFPSSSIFTSMKSHPSLPAAFIFAVLASAFSGCISSSTTSYNDVERTKVNFASERAGRLFYETISKIPADRREESRNSVSLILINFERKTITGPNRKFNETVERCDTNRDGTITDEEAQIFAASVAAQKSAP